MKLKFGIVGGGNGAFIGDVHRHGALMDNMASLVCGCFTRNYDKNLETAKLWGVDEERAYADFKSMAKSEAQREDGIDFVIIVTPNDVHFEIAKEFLEHGINVVCDKPITMNTEEANELVRLVEETKLLFGVTYTYTAYPMIRQARELVDSGKIGKITNVMLEYPQEWLAIALSTSNSEHGLWRLDPKKAGNSQACADIATHLEALASFATGLELTHVLARFNKIPNTLALESDVQAMLKYSDGENNDIPGLLWASQIALGNEAAIKIRVFGEKGSFEWSHVEPSVLKVSLLNQPTMIYTNSRDFNCAKSNEITRLPSGHPEGYYEAFGNIYYAFCKHLLSVKYGQDRGNSVYPDIYDGLNGIKFVEACIKSNEDGNIWKQI